MTRRTVTKEELVQSIVARQKDVIDHSILEPNLVDLLVPLEGPNGKVKAIDDDGNVIIEFKAPISSSLRFLNKAKLQAILEMLDEVAPVK